MSTADEDFEPLRGHAPSTKMALAELVVYRRIVNSAPVGWLTTADESAVAELARVEVQLQNVNAEVANLIDHVVHSSHGDIAHPLVQHQDRLRRRMSQLRTELRLTPSARAKKLPTTKLGVARAEAETSAQAIADATPASRSHLMFGGRRAAEALGLGDDD